MKFCRAGAVPVSLDTGLGRMRDRVIAADFPDGDQSGRSSARDMLDEYADHVRGFADTGALRPLRVAVDAGNGMAGLIVPAAFDPTPIRIVPLYFELDGTFPNHPANPIEPENLRRPATAGGRGGLRTSDWPLTAMPIVCSASTNRAVAYPPR